MPVLNAAQNKLLSHSMYLFSQITLIQISIRGLTAFLLLQLFDSSQKACSTSLEQRWLIRFSLFYVHFTYFDLTSYCPMLSPLSPLPPAGLYVYQTVSLFAFTPLTQPASKPSSSALPLSASTPVNSCLVIFSTQPSCFLSPCPLPRGPLDGWMDVGIKD